jgi:hypothetical protein
MLTYSVPTLIKGRPIVKYPQGTAATDHTGGPPLEAESGVIGSPPSICGAWMEECTVELDGEAHRAQ